jgi:predicted NAD/FAD-binding protein
MQSIAIIGTGIAGMACGHFLHKKYDVTFYEQNDYVGGHTNTVTIDEEGNDIHIDTGFMVFNHVTYPHLTKLFNELDVPTIPTSMSFSVQHVPSRLEYCGSGLNGLFAQRKNIFSPSFIKMLKQISRFNEESVKILDDERYASHTLADYIREKGFSDEMMYKYLIPMSAAVWSAPMDLMLQFPAVTLIRFFKNHGFLGLNTQHQWHTVRGGSRMYRDIIIKPFKDKIQVNNAAVKIRREAGKAIVHSADGSSRTFDKAILACHGDQALRMLDNPTYNEHRILEKFRYQENTALLHMDESVMPRTKRTWSSWNYRIEEKKDGMQPSTIYWMNSLQQVSQKKNYFVSINDPGNVHESKILKEIRYEHPLFDVAAIKAQKELPVLNENGPVYFCGSYFRYGFHEDALMSSVELSRQLMNKEEIKKQEIITEELPVI